MAKETTIIFVYDTELLKREEDDPNSAILYFYPTWVSEQQKTALCGQLMGTMLCLKSVLAMPKMICLQTGKFFLIENGRYILVVGTDTNIPSSVLEQRANHINSLVNFFHKDFITLGRLYEKENLTAKLFHIFDTYLKLLFLGGCPFSQIPLSNLPKTDNEVLTSTQAILNHCKTIPQILGGLILYHNKVLHTQLCAETTKKIVFSDPFRIKNPAELSDLAFEVPEGVKLLQVHITAEEYQELYRNSACNKNSLTQPESKETEAVPASLTKINSSILFTSVPEDATFSPNKVILKNPRENHKNKRSRPNSLNLKSCSLDSSADTQSSRRLTPITPYWTQSSSVCTPMTETKPFVDQASRRTSRENVWRISSMGFHKLTLDASIETFQCPLEVYSRRLEKAERLSSFVRGALEKTSMHRSSSLQNLSQINSIPNPLNQYSSCRNKVCFKSKKSINLRRCKSVHDPAYPWCKGDKVAASQYYVEEVLDEDFFVEREQCTFRELITERKRSLTLPIKPHNASEAQKTDMKSPGGYCTPLMNKLSMANVLERQTSSKDIPLASFVAKDETDKTDDDDDRRSELKRCILFMFGKRDLVLAALLPEDCLRNKTSIEKLRKLCTEQLATLEDRIKAAMEPPKPITSPNAEAYSMLSFDGDWGTLQRSGPWNGAELNDLTRLHRDFGECNDITEIYLRKPESVLYGHRQGGSEAFYLEAAALSDGLLLPNDAMGSVHQTAKRRLEKNHDVFIK